MVYKYFPELEKVFNNYWINDRGLEIDYLDLPANIDNYLTYNPKGVFNLLFDNSYSQDSYVYKLKQVTDQSVSKPIRERISYTVNIINIYMISEEEDKTVNIFEFTSDDIVMFDFLLEYRQGLTPDMSSINYSELSTRLSKLIFVYLDLMVNLSFEYLLNTINTVQSNDLLSSLFELYVISEAHKLIKKWKMTVDSGYIKLRPVRDDFIIDSDILDVERVCLELTPYDEEDLTVYINGEHQDSSYFNLITVDTTAGPSKCISWLNSPADITSGDLLLIDYYIEVS